MQQANKQKEVFGDPKSERYMKAVEDIMNQVEWWSACYELARYADDIDDRTYDEKVNRLITWARARIEVEEKIERENPMPPVLERQGDSGRVHDVRAGDVQPMRGAEPPVPSVPSGDREAREESTYSDSSSDLLPPLTL